MFELIERLSTFTGSDYWKNRYSGLVIRPAEVDQNIYCPDDHGRITWWAFAAGTVNAQLLAITTHTDLLRH